MASHPEYHTLSNNLEHKKPFCLYYIKQASLSYIRPSSQNYIKAKEIVIFGPIIYTCDVL